MLNILELGACVLLASSGNPSICWRTCRIRSFQTPGTSWNCVQYKYCRAWL